MISVLRKKSILKFVQTQINHRNTYRGDIKLKRLGVLIDARKDIDIFSIVKLADQVGVKPNQLQIMGLKEVKSLKPEEEVAGDGHTNYFDEKKITFSGKFTSTALQNFVSTDFDVLINFYEEDYYMLNAVAASSKAKFKVGFATVNNKINDLVIGTPAGNTNVFIQELKKYLKILDII